MKKIIHLSDTQIGDKDLTIRMSKVVSKIKSLVTQDTPASDYVIVHTGDVIKDAEFGYGQLDAFDLNNTYPEMEKSAIGYFKELNKAGFKNILFVPGNHDYGQGSHHIEKNNVDAFNTFRLIFSEQKALTQTYPITTIIDNIAFIGLDSLEGRFESKDSHFSVNGKFGDRQLIDEETGLLYILRSQAVKECDYRVVYLHYHPTDFNPETGSGIEDSPRFKEILKEYQISALLFGHNHDGEPFNDEAQEWGVGGIKRIYDGGSSTAIRGTFSHDPKRCPFRIIDLSNDDPRLDDNGTFAD